MIKRICADYLVYYCRADCQPAGDLASGEIHGITHAESPRTKSSQPEGRLCHRKRKPCHGWISDDDEEEELIEVPLVPLSNALHMLVNDGVNSCK